MQQRKRRSFGLVVGMVAGALTLAACGAETQPAQSAPASESAPEATPTQTQTPTPDETPPTDRTIDFDGIGQYLVGEDVATAVASVSPPYSVAPASACPNPQTRILRSEDSPTIWLHASADTGYLDIVAVGGDAPDDPREAASPRTESGVALGSSLSEVEAAYPGGVLESNDQGEADRFVVSGAASSGDPRYLVFQFSESDVQTILVQAASDKVWEFCG